MIYLEVCILPDRSFVLHEVSKSVFNDTSWCPVDKLLIFVHDSIARTVAEKLGVRTVRNEKFELYCAKEEYFGSDFGQGEELTQRIQNILTQYPFDVTILKELLQNADDAKATKMCIILDKRIHKGECLVSAVPPPAQLGAHYTTYMYSDGYVLTYSCSTGLYLLWCPLSTDVGGMGERCKLPHWDLGRSPRTFMFKSHTKFDHFS